MPLILQTSKRPTEVLLALNELADAATTRFRAAVAYVTRDGVETLYREMEERITNWRTIPKTLVASFDFHLTDPDALRRTLGLPNFEVFIANLTPAPGGGFSPSNRMNFHPKLYLFDRGPNRDLLVGSANLSGRALDVNTEACFLERSAPAAEVERMWAEVMRDVVPLTPNLLAEYAKAHPARRPLDPSPPLIEVQLPASAAIQTFADRLGAGLDPTAYQSFWIEAGSMSSGGSHNQLELPRGGHRFFGHAFTRYGSTKDAEPIGQIDLLARSLAFHGRPLTWHGNNKMERLNLPTAVKGGFDYKEMAVLFRRAGAQFEVDVAPWTSAKAIAWRNASATAGLVFRLGGKGRRLCGLF